MTVLCTFGLTVFLGFLWVEQKSGKFHLREVYDAFEMESNQIIAYEPLDETDSFAIQADGDFSYTTNYLMSTEYRYKSGFSTETSQSQKQYYFVSIYNLNDSDNQKTTINLFRHMPEINSESSFSEFLVTLYEHEGKAHLKVDAQDKDEKETTRYFEVVDNQTLKQVTAGTFADEKVAKSSKDTSEHYPSSYLATTLGQLEKLGETRVSVSDNSNWHSSYSNYISIDSFDQQQLTVYETHPKILEMAKERGRTVSTLTMNFFKIR